MDRVKNIKLSELGYVYYDFEEQKILSTINGNLWKYQGEYWVELKQLCYTDIADKIISPTLEHPLWEDNDNYYYQYDGIWKIPKDNLAKKSFLCNDYRAIEELEFSNIGYYDNIKIFIKYLFEKRYVSELHFKDNVSLFKDCTGNYFTKKIIKNIIDF